jgi:hypothetical protein
MKKILTILLLAISLSLGAQEKIEITEDDYANTQVEMADQFREDGKIYVVVAVMTIILTGLLLYAYLIDRKVSKIEDSMNE